LGTVTFESEERGVGDAPGCSFPSPVGSVAAAHLPLCKPLNRDSWQLIVVSSGGCTCVSLHPPSAIFFFEHVLHNFKKQKTLTVFLLYSPAHRQGCTETAGDKGESPEVTMELGILRLLMLLRKQVF